MEKNTHADHGRSNRPGNDTSLADRWLLRVRGPVDVEIIDQEGHRIGRYIEREEEEERRIGRHRGEEEEEGRRRGRRRREHEDEESSREERRRHNGQAQELPNLYEVSIPGASYNPGQNFSSAFLTQPGIYICQFLGQAPSTVDIYFTSFRQNGGLDTIFFQAIAMTERSRAQFVYNTSEVPIVPVLTLQEDDRSPAQEIPPTAILGPEESQDTTPPRTTISIQGDEVSISAADNPGGSGVLYTYYTTDVETFTMYQQPFPLPPDAKIVMAFSIDRNGNREYPGAVVPVLAVSETHVVFTATVGDQEVPPQTVRVLNLDPIAVTGQLVWEAWTDVPWLSVEPRQGKTPGLITLSVKIGKLEPGTYTGDVIVRSPAPGVVFAERVVVVTSEVSRGQGPVSSGTIS